MDKSIEFTKIEVVKHKTRALKENWVFVDSEKIYSMNTEEDWIAIENELSEIFIREIMEERIKKSTIEDFCTNSDGSGNNIRLIQYLWFATTGEKLLDKDVLELLRESNEIN